MCNASALLRLQAGIFFGLQLLSRKNRFFKLCRTLQKRYWLLRKGTHDRKRIGDQQICFSFLSLFSCRVRPLLTGNRNLRLIMIHFFPAYWTNSSSSSSLSNQDGNGSGNFTLKANSRCFKRVTLIPLFHFVQFVKCWEIFFWTLILKEIWRTVSKNCCLVFASSIKRETGRLHVVVVQQR